MSDNLRSDFRVITPMRVRYAEADMQGIVFNANYLLFGDIGITEYFRELIADKQTEADGAVTGLTEIYGGDNWVRHAEVDFRASARADDMIDICTRISRFGNTSYSALVHIIRGDELLTVINLSYVWFDPATETKISVSEKFIQDVCDFEVIKPEIAR